MSLIQSAKLSGHDPYRYLKDVLERLPTHPASRIDELLPHRWQPPADPSITEPQIKLGQLAQDEMPRRLPRLRRCAEIVESVAKNPRTESQRPNELLLATALESKKWTVRSTSPPETDRGFQRDERERPPMEYCYCAINGALD